MGRGLVALGLFWALGLVPAPVSADVRDELFQATLLFEQAYFGNVMLSEGGVFPLEAPSGPTLGASLRFELLPSKWIGIGVEGSASSFRIGDGAFIPGPAIEGAGSTPIVFDGRGLILGTNGFIRLRLGLNGGRGEYYLIGGGGPAWLAHDSSQPNFYGESIRGGNDLGWTAYARIGVRGELAPGFGALLEIGWIHREHLDAFQQNRVIAGSTVVGIFDYVTNQLSITIGWYVSR